MGLSIYSKNLMLASILGSNTNWSALLTTLPANSGAGYVESTTAGYARVNTTGLWFTETPGGYPSQVWRVNTAQFNWPSFTAAGTTVVGFGVFDASTGGNLLAWAPFTDGSGNLITIAVTSGLQITLDEFSSIISIGEAT